MAYLFSDAPGGRPDDPMPGMLSAVSLRNGRVMWEMPLPARPFAVGPFGAWLSHDEKRIYLQSTRDGLNPRMLTIDVQARHMLHDHSLHIPYPANVDQAFPIAWRLPWTERFIVISRDQLYAYDPGTGQKSDVIHLFKPDDRALVPWDMPRATFVMDGLMDASRRRLILATSTQELIWVDLTTSPFTLHRVAKLTPGWRFGGASGLLLHPDGMTLYAQVRPVYPVEQIMAVTEVLSFDTKTWQQTGRHVLCQDPYGCDSLFRRGAPYSFGLLIHPSDNRLYAFTEHGLMQVDQPPNTALEENLMKIDGLNTSDWYTILYSPGG
ncbi:MAG: hypothetical protein RMN52_02040 [Anaerolineae bacterium]|nr:hypothetical protein [Candidatus Roseilinea sp.]MDW8448761.1 hypothetical protein [Anaerolineae bacterium]